MRKAPLPATALLLAFAASALAQAPERAPPPPSRPGAAAARPAEAVPVTIAVPAPPERPEDEAPPPEGPATDVGAETEMRVGQAAAVAPRPVMRPDRRDAEAVGASGPAARAATLVDAMPLDETVLIGVIGRGDRRFALLRTPEGELKRVERGQSVEGWTVVEIADDSVRLRDARGATRRLDFP